MGTVWGQEVHYKGARFNNIHGDIKLDNHILTITNGHIGDGDGAMMLMVGIILIQMC